MFAKHFNDAWQMSKEEGKFEKRNKSLQDEKSFMVFAIKKLEARQKKYPRFVALQATAIKNNQYPFIQSKVH